MSTQRTMEKEVSHQTSVEMPTLSVDESESVEERFTDNTINNILPARYLKKDSNGNVIETPDEMFDRVADKVAEAEFLWGDEDDFEEWKEKFYTTMVEQWAMPNSPALMNMGDELNMGSACFVASPEDSMESIFETAKKWALIQKTGGGIGGAFHKLRPKGGLVSSTKGRSSGPISFMEHYNSVAGTILQGGTRRGAQMGIMRVDHADIGRFATSKRKEGELDNFNISVAITNDFLDAVESDEEYTFYDPISDFKETQEVIEETAHFYSPEYQDQPESLVDENFWRDFADEMKVTRDGDTHSFREEWEDDERLRLEEGEEMKLPAQFIFDIIVDGAWKNGEPGLVHLDEINKHHSFDGEEYKVDSTNPSLVAGTRVLTDGGVKPIEELEGKSFKTRSLNERWAEASCWKSGEDENLYEITTNTGFTYKATPEHKWPVINDGTISKKNSESLESGDWIPLTKTDDLGYGDTGEYSDGLIVGWLYGDGSITDRNNVSGADTQYGFTISEKDKNAGILDFIVTKLEEITTVEYSPTKRNRGGEDWYEIHARNELIDNYMEKFGVSNKSKGIPNSIWSTGSEEFRKGFIDGLFSADGYVDENDGRVILTTSREQIAEDIVSLLSFYGIKSTRRKSVSESFGKEYERHDVTISNTPAIRFRELFNLSHDEKQSSLEQLSYKPYTTVKSSAVKVESVSESDETADVWDISVLDESHTFPIAGSTTGNCSEQPLMDYESCNLMHVNLSLLVEDDAPTFDEYVEEYDYDTTSAAAQDYFDRAVNVDQLEEVTQTIVRFLDNMIEVSDFPLDELNEQAQNTRKIGVGLMGWGQMLYQMGVRYGSDESIELARQTMAHVDAIATEYSHELALDRGVFEIWDDSKYAEPEEYPDWFRKHAHQLPEDHPDGYKIRNHNVTTVAPTGTTSLIADTSGGIEPVYNVAYKKNVGNDIQGDDMLVEFDKYFLKTLEENDIDVEEIKREASEKMRTNSFEGIESLDVPDKLKDVFVTTNDITPEEHVDMQRAFQEYCDSGLSKTLNMPNDADREDVQTAYVRAMRDDGVGSPAKGTTVYRDGSRKKQVLNTGEITKAEIEEAKNKLEKVGYEVSKK